MAKLLVIGTFLINYQKYQIENTYYYCISKIFSGILFSINREKLPVIYAK